ncbi:helix-turn-helix domain-containing protein [Acidovorax sp.]|uniref:helix-turn-helix transcriptional regulator n=1 Tax=Acidovorax sp. TaxID=1872122 RepID=UPI00391DBC90
MQRAPCPELSPVVALLWAHDHPDVRGFDAHDHGHPEAAKLVQQNRGPGPAQVTEHVLPTGLAHLVFRTSAGPGATVFDSVDSSGGLQLPEAVIGGPRSRFYLKQSVAPARSVGVLLRAGGVRALWGLPAHAVAGQHVALADVWGEQGRELGEELLGMACPARRLARLEAALLEIWRCRAAAGGPSVMHPAVVRALRGLSDSARVEPWLQGLSHRHFIHLFRDAVGLTPKAFAQVQRVRAALRDAVLPGATLAQVAAARGYADQSHFHREVRAVAGVSPSDFVRLSTDGGSHLRLPSHRSNLSKTRRR